MVSPMRSAELHWQLSLGLVGLMALGSLGALGAALGTGATKEAEDVREVLTRQIPMTLPEARDRTAQRGGEALDYQWSLGGFLGTIAGLFVPSHGNALLSFVPTRPGHVEIQILITAPKRDGEYFLYGAEVDRQSGDTTAVWSSYTFRGRRKDREQEVSEPDIIDFASAIYHLRSDLPRTDLEMTIWNGGSTYPVVVEHLGTSTRTIDGKKQQVRGYVVVGSSEQGKPAFKERYFLYFSDDERVLPAQIVGKRGLIQLKLDLVRRS